MNELWAKLGAREKLVAIGAALVAVGALVGMILGTKTYGGETILGYKTPSVSVNYFTAENAGTFAVLALIGAIATLVVLYLKVAPNMKVNWPAPFVQVLLVVAGITAICAVLVLLMQLIRAGGLGDDPPIMMYIADVLVVGGGVLMGYAAYMEWSGSKT